MHVRWSLVIAFWTGCVGAAPPDLEGVDDSDSGTHERSTTLVAGNAKVVDTGGLGLRLRSGAGADFAVIVVMPEGSAVTVGGTPSGAWHRVTYKQQVGWAHGDFLRNTSDGDKNNLLPWDPGVTFQVTQGHNGGSHTGLGAWAWDFGLPIGTPVRAAHYGTVRLVKGNSAVGGCNSVYANDANFVIVDQGNGYESLYLHLSAITVGAGDVVERGDLVGYSGQTGWSCGPHLHFQVQLSPANGGGAGFYNPSIHDVFYDPGSAFDPAPGTFVTSRNTGPK